MVRNQSQVNPEPEGTRPAAGTPERVIDSGLVIDCNEFQAALRALISEDDQEIRTCKHSLFVWALREISTKYQIHAHSIDRGRWVESIVDHYADIYIRLCNFYNKNLTFETFAVVLGTSADRIYEWTFLADYANSGLRVSALKIKQAAENTVKGYASDAAGRGNGLAMALLANHEHGWNNPAQVPYGQNTAPSVDMIAGKVALLLEKSGESKQND